MAQHSCPKGNSTTLLLIEKILKAAKDIRKLKYLYYALRSLISPLRWGALQRGLPHWSVYTFALKPSVVTLKWQKLILRIEQNLFHFAVSVSSASVNNWAPILSTQSVRENKKKPVESASNSCSSIVFFQYWLFDVHLSTDGEGWAFLRMS